MSHSSFFRVTKQNDKFKLRLLDPRNQILFTDFFTKVNHKKAGSKQNPEWIIEEDSLLLLDDFIEALNKKNRKSSRFRIRRQNAVDKNEEVKEKSKSPMDSSPSIYISPDNDTLSDKSKIDSEDQHGKSNSSSYEHPDEDEDDSKSEYEESSDDELIQKALARKLMSESEQKEISDEQIEDSDREDCLSLCRRLRHLYNTLNNHEMRLNEMEKLKSEK